LTHGTLTAQTHAMSDDENPTAAQDQIIPGVTPSALLDAMENPDSFAEIARADLYVQMAHLRRVAAHPEFPTSARLELVKVLSKMGKVDAPQADVNPLAGVPMIEIDLGSAGTVKIGSAYTPEARREVDITPDEHDVKLPSTAVLP
jgi:septum formation topological specificity factor MinE